MPLSPDSESKDINVPADYHTDHPDESPSMWGWHGEWGGFSRVGGIIVVLILWVLVTTSHYNRAGNVWLYIFMGAIVVALIWDHQRRRNLWRK